MLEAHGLLQLTQRSETARGEVQLLHRNASTTAQRKTGSADNTSSSARQTSTGLNSKSSVTPPALAMSGSMQAFWQQAADKAAQNAPSADMMKKLLDSTKSDNQDIAAQKMQEAKAKLQALRLQAQLAAASGDKQQLRRLAQEVAAAAREVASAAHDLAGGVVASATDAGSSSIPMAAVGESGTPGTESEKANNANTNDANTGGLTESGPASGPTPSPVQMADRTDLQNTDPTQSAGDKPPLGDPSSTDSSSGQPTDKKPIYAQQPPQGGDPIAWGEQALNSLSTDANNAIAQARGLLAFIATSARNKRKSGESSDDDRFFSDLQRVVDTAQAQVNSDMADARSALAAGPAPAMTGLPTDTGLPLDTGAGDTGAGPDIDAGGDSFLGLDTVTITQVTTTAVFLNITT